MAKAKRRQIALPGRQLSEKQEPTRKGRHFCFERVAPPIEPYMGYSDFLLPSNPGGAGSLRIAAGYEIGARKKRYESSAF